MPDTAADENDLAPRETFEAQVYNALSSAIRATAALWELHSALHTENNGGSVSWDRIEENVWEANEAAGFLETYVQDEAGVVAQFRKLESERLEVPSEVAEKPPMQLLKYVQRLAEHPDSAMAPEDVAVAATNITDAATVADIANQREDGPVLETTNDPEAVE